MPNRGMRRLKNLYGELTGKAMPFKYDNEEYTVPLKGEMNEITGEISTGNDLWPVELAEFAAEYMVDRIIIDCKDYWYESVKPRGMAVTVKGGMKLLDEDLKLSLLEQILGPKPSTDGKQKVSLKEQMKEQVRLAKQEEAEEFAGLNEGAGSTYEEIEAKLSWNDIQSAAVENDVKVTNKDETIKGLVAKGFKVQ